MENQTCSASQVTYFLLKLSFLLASESHTGGFNQLSLELVGWIRVYSRTRFGSCLMRWDGLGDGSGGSVGWSILYLQLSVAQCSPSTWRVYIIHTKLEIVLW